MHIFYIPIHIYTDILAYIHMNISGEGEDFTFHLNTKKTNILGNKYTCMILRRMAHVCLCLYIYVVVYVYICICNYIDTFICRSVQYLYYGVLMCWCCCPFSRFAFTMFILFRRFESLHRQKKALYVIRK